VAGTENGGQGVVDSDAAGAAVEAAAVGGRGCGGEQWEVSKSVMGFTISVCFWTVISFLFFGFHISLHFK
jgi:hypothetical protein